jgi:hypothetical protein
MLKRNLLTVTAAAILPSAFDTDKSLPQLSAGDGAMFASVACTPVCIPAISNLRAIGRPNEN